MRQQVYAKYGGHCAYCGKSISYEEMQCDHFVAKRRGTDQAYWDSYAAKGGKKIVVGTDELSNLMPACRQCNFRKGEETVETFRQDLRKQAAGEMKRFQARQSADYGQIEYHDHPITFYFEKYAKHND